MELIIVRHGETAWTISGQHTGTTELELTEHGRREARAAGPLVDRLVGGRTPTVVSSPRQRALETARLVFPDHPVVVTPLVAEVNYGDYEGLTSDEITKVRPGWTIWRDACPEGESISEVGSRASTFLAQLDSLGPAPTVVVTHGHFSRILAAVALGLDPAQGALLTSATASVSHLLDARGRTSMSLWNATATFA